MAKWVDKNAIKAARLADLYGFLLHHHARDIEIEGNSLRLRDNHSVTLKEGYSGWTDWATGNTGNAIELLTEHLGYDFQDAVIALCAYMGITNKNDPLTFQPVCQPESKPQTSLIQPTEPMVPPAPLQGQYRQLFAYLTQTRKIPPAVVQRLIDDGILYQEADHANIVFIDPARTFAELRGTNTSKPFHKVMFSDPAAFWWFKPQGLTSNATVALVCEAAIDAISLYLLHMNNSHVTENGLYCSIAGVANQQRIDRIKEGMAAAGLQTMIAVDNDEAGEKCRQRNPDCPYLIPNGKDWNEDWKNKIADV